MARSLIRRRVLKFVPSPPPNSHLANVECIVKIHSEAVMMILVSRHFNVTSFLYRFILSNTYFVTVTLIWMNDFNLFCRYFGRSRQPCFLSRRNRERHGGRYWLLGLVPPHLELNNPNPTKSPKSHRSLPNITFARRILLPLSICISICLSVSKLYLYRVPFKSRQNGRRSQNGGWHFAVALKWMFFQAFKQISRVNFMCNYIIINSIL